MTDVATSTCRSRTPVHSTDSWHSYRSPLNSQQTNRNNSPDVHRPLRKGSRAEAKIIQGSFRRLISRIRLQVRCRHHRKFDPAAAMLNPPVPPRGAQGPPGVELLSPLPVALGILCGQAVSFVFVFVLLILSFTTVDCTKYTSSPLLFYQ